MDCSCFFFEYDLDFFAIKRKKKRFIRTKDIPVYSLNQPLCPIFFLTPGLFGIKIDIHLLSGSNQFTLGYAQYQSEVSTYYTIPGQRKPKESVFDCCGKTFSLMVEKFRSQTNRPATNIAYVTRHT